MNYIGLAVWFLICMIAYYLETKKKKPEIKLLLLSQVIMTGLILWIAL